VETILLTTLLLVTILYNCKVQTDTGQELHPLLLVESL
jgi:hypothetical protein